MNQKALAIREGFLLIDVLSGLEEFHFFTRYFAEQHVCQS